MLKPPQCASCPVAGRSFGFCLDSGDPERARIAFVLEAPGDFEIKFRVDDEEYARRVRLYPELSNGSLRTGAPLVGKAGAAWEHWLLRAAGINRAECYITNTIRCLDVKQKDGSRYPTGKDRVGAEAACRQYDRMRVFAPDVAVVTLHPASLLRDLTPMDLVVKDLRKAAHFAADGHRPVVCMGGKAAKMMLGLSDDAVTAIRGSYYWLAYEEPEPDPLEVGA